MIWLRITRIIKFIVLFHYENQSITQASFDEFHIHSVPPFGVNLVPLSVSHVSLSVGQTILPLAAVRNRVVLVENGALTLLEPFHVVPHILDPTVVLVSSLAVLLPVLEVSFVSSLDLLELA
jgi:hypothetical protein